ncbi:MAG: AzlD domain-containing protein [Propionibacteriaceae bacterium]|nr:AzlD domain-containing protein [Propionibacteriaceae bacterium]
MNNWAWILVASVTAYATKLAGYLLPRKLLEGKTVTSFAPPLTVGLLAALTITNAFSSGQAILIDARLISFVAAIIALRFKLPFIVVIIVGALAAALGRLLGLPSWYP